MTIECACSSVRNSGQEKWIKWTTSNNMIDHDFKLVQTLFNTYYIKTKRNDDHCIVKDLSIYLYYKKEKKKSDTIIHM